MPKATAPRPPKVPPAPVTVESVVFEALAQLLTVPITEELTRSSELIADLGADSLELVELVMDLEERFGIEVPDEEAEQWKTAGDVIDWLTARHATPKPPNPADRY